MSSSSNIAWTNATWNPVRGCERVSQGCVNCYAEVLAARHSYPGGWGEGLAKWITKADGTREAHWTGVLQTVETMLDAPLRWRTPRRIFVNSMSDLFHEDVPDDFILRIFDVMRQSCNGHARALNRNVPTHTFQILTKRPERMQYFMGRMVWKDGLRLDGPGLLAGPLLTNVWLGISAEDQDTFDERVEFLGRTPAAVRFVSAEPFLGNIDIGNAFDPSSESYGKLDWAIIGGETGQGRRPMDMEAARAFIQQVKLMGGAMFVKQDSGPRPGMRGRFTDAEWALKEYPA